MLTDSNPLISVVIPLYNAAPYIRRSVDSVLKQTYQNFELIVVDDGSKDNSGSLVQAYTDSRLRLVVQDNNGASAARNRGIKEGRGSLIAFLDADDEWGRTFLECVLNLVSLYPQAGIYGTGYRMTFPDGPGVEVTAAESDIQHKTVLIEDYFYRAIGGSLINSSGIMIPRRIFELLGSFIAGEHHGEDLEMWARIALRFPIAYDTSINFTFHQTGIANKQRYRYLPRYGPHLRLLENVLSQPSDADANRDLLETYIKDRQRKECLNHINDFDRKSTIAFIKANRTELWLPVLCRIVAIRAFWPLLRLGGRFHRLLNSRMLLRMIGGTRVSHGVLHRLKSPTE
jgi:glycosyltransferase involved in cell wall biosynthesis